MDLKRVSKQLDYLQKLEDWRKNQNQAFNSAKTNEKTK